MSPRRSPDNAEGLTQEDVEAWLRQEIDHSRKAMELRVKGATDIATAFQENRISAQEVADQIYRHENRWGEALPGVWTTEGKTNEQTLAEVDEARTRQQRRREQAGRRRAETRGRDR